MKTIKSWKNIGKDVNMVKLEKKLLQNEENIKLFFIII